MNKLLKNLKSKNIKNVLVIVLLLVLCGGISFAAYNYTSNASDNALKSGQISMTYTEPSNTVILKNALPKEDELGKSQTEYFEFSVMSNATTNEDDDKGVTIPYEISISKVDVDASLKQLEDKDVKIYLTKLEGNTEEVVLGPILIGELEQSEYDQEGLKIYDTKNKHSNNQGSITTKYRIRFWLDNNVDVSNWSSTGEYEYKFKVNVNANSDYLDVANQNTLASRIKTMYTVENGTAIEEDGYYYLNGSEQMDLDNDPTANVLMYYGYLGNVYLYRQEADNGDVEPVSNIKQVTDTKEYTYNQELLEHNLHNYMIITGIKEEEYNQIAGPFGGYASAVLGTIAGVVDMSSMTFVEGKTIEDIPTLDEAMANEDMKPLVIEMFAEIIPYIVATNKDSFLHLYYEDSRIKYDVLNANLEFGSEALGLGDKQNDVITNFGSLSNYCIASANGLVDESGNVPKLIEGKTINDIPTLESIILRESTPLLTNTYVKLNNILWKVMGVNSDNTIKLIATSPMYNYYSNGHSFNESEIAKYLGHGKYEDSSPFLLLIKGTTLEDIIIKTKYEYEENEKKETVIAYASIPSYEEFKNSMKGEFSYLVTPNEYDITVAKKNTDYTLFYNEGNELREVTGSAMYGNPTITIEDIEVNGEGTKTNPYVIENEKISSIENVVKSIHDSIMKLNYSFRELYLYIDAEYKYEQSLSDYSEFEGEKYSTGISINGKCYYNTIDGNSKEIEYAGECADNFVDIATEPASAIDTYSFNETTISIVADNAESYQWQQKVGDKWVDVEDYTGRISGSKTSTLTIIPTSYFDKVIDFRCIVDNGISKRISRTSTVNITLTDGEWKYEEIEDTNKFRITGHVRENMEESYSLTPTGETGYKDLPIYDLVIPSVINGDVIERVDSVYGPQWEYGSGYNIIYNMSAFLRNVEFEEGIKIIGRLLFNSGYIKKVTLPSTVELIESSAFHLNTINEINLQSAINLKKIEKNAFYDNSIDEIIIPDSVVEIGEGAFEENNPKTIKLGSGLITIGESAFHNFNNSVDYGQYEGELTIPDNVTSIGSGAFCGLGIEELNIGNGIKRIESGTFCNNNIIEIVIPDSVEYLSGFNANPLETITIPNSVKIIGDDAFGTTSLSSVVLPDSLEIIGESAFYGAGLKSITIPESVISIGDKAFRGNDLKSVTIPKNVQTIGTGAFFKGYVYIDYGNNEDLTTIVNKTGLAFDWNDIINEKSGVPFITGTVTNGYGNVTITE